MKMPLKFVVVLCASASLTLSTGSAAAWSDDPTPVTSPVPEPSPTPEGGTKAAEEPREEDPGEEGRDEATLTQDEAAHVDPAQKSELDSEVDAVPTSVKVTGVLAVIAAEQSEAAGSSEQPMVFVAIDDGPMVELAAEDIPEHAVTGQEFEGEVRLTAQSKSEISEQVIDAESTGEPLTERDVLFEAAKTEDGAVAQGTVGATQATAVDSATSTRWNQVDLVYFTGSELLNRTQAKRYISDASTYWYRQTLGKIAFNVASYTVVKNTSLQFKCRDDPTGIYAKWNLAAQKAQGSGWNWRTYLGGKRYLAIIVNEPGGTCKGIAGGTIGRATIGETLTWGGVSWTNVGARTGSPSNGNPTIFHELGHNLGLWHANARACWASYNDNTLPGRAAVPPCGDYEYADLYNVMGNPDTAINWVEGLSLAQKVALGVADGMRKISVSYNGMSREYELKPLGADSGLRGLRIRTANGGNFYVEYRAPVGLDSVIGATKKEYVRGGVKFFADTRGIRVLKLGSQVAGPTSSQVLTVPVAGAFRETLSKDGEMIWPYASNARVTLVGTPTDESARVRVDYQRFTDVPFDYAFYENINWMHDNNLFTSDGTKQYKPNSHLSRAAMAAFLHRAAGRPAVDLSVQHFDDVPKSDPFFDEIEWMYQEGLFTGSVVNGKRLYKPYSHLSRAAMAAFLYRYEDATLNETTPQYSDVRSGDFLFREINWMYASGKFRPTSGEYDPNGHISRAAMAAFLSRM